MNKVETINESITEIREILGAECTPVNELPNLVRSLVEDPARSGFTTAFVFSRESNPNQPTGGSLDTTTGLVLGVEGGGSQNNTIKSVDIPIWMSHAVFDPSGEIVTDWSIPVNLKGKTGDPGKDGKDGEVGPAGPKGEQGVAGQTYRTVSVYVTTDGADIIPGRPRGGHGDIKTNKISQVVSDTGAGYETPYGEPNPKKYLGTSSVTFGEDGDPMGEWCEPFRITGEDGKDGADGKVTEFIYRRIPDYDTYKELVNQLSGDYPLTSKNEEDYVPEVSDILNINTKGTDQPQGITRDLKIEVCCSRIRKSIDEPGSDGSKCIIWSNWGEDGMDGDGVEYIYLVTPATTNDNKSVTPEYVKSVYTPDLYEALDNPNYQKDGFCFNESGGYSGYGGTDEPSDVGPGKPMEGVMVRKYKDNRWERFSNPTLWATYSEDGVSYFTSFVFTRSAGNKIPNKPEGGDYYNPKPNGDIWKDSIPTTDLNLPVGMSTRVFCSTDSSIDKGGTTPTLMADSPEFQVEYAKADIIPHLDKFTGDEKTWRESQLAYGITWGDDSEITDPNWMITATRHFGVWSDGTVSKIKGEKGDKGDPGTSVSIKFKAETIEQLYDQGDVWLINGTFFDSTELNAGEGCFVNEDGNLYVYSGGYVKDSENTEFETYGINVGNIKGEPGESSYIQIAYCEELVSDATLYFDNPKKYIGIAYSTVPFTDDKIKNDWNNYTWSQGKGEDGGGQEQVFLLTSKELGFDPNGEHLPLPTNNDINVPNYLPIHAYSTNAYPADKGSDTPITPTKEYPYCWVAVRKGQGSLFGEWIGYNNKASLYSRYSYDGVDAVFVSLTNDLAVIPMENGQIDPEFKDVVNTTVNIYVGDEQVTSDNFVVTGEKVSIEGNVVTLNLDEIDDDVTQIPLNVEFANKTYKLIGKILQTDVAYEVIPRTKILKRYSEGNSVGKLSESKLYVDIWKWSNNKGIPSNIPLFAEIRYTNGSTEILSTEDGIVVANGLATIDLSNLSDVFGIKVYVVQQDSEGKYWSTGEILSFENISVVSDGTSGGRTVFLYTISKNSDDYIQAPTGGILDTSTNLISGIVTKDSYSGTMTPPVKTDGYTFVGQTIAQFNGSGILTTEGSQPICITGENGQDGADGSSIEFIYRLLPNYDKYLELKTHLSSPGNALNNTDTGIVPDKNDTISSTKGTNDPSGIDNVNYKTEVVCSRKAILEDGKFVGWEPWSEPSLGSMWGEEGKDGPGTEYIYCITAPDINSNALRQSLDVYYNDDRYQEDDFYPSKYYPNSDGKDEPQDTNEDKPLEWVSTRKKVDGKWEPFTKPIIWSRYTTNGLSYKTVYVFTRAVDKPSTPSGGTWDATEPDLVDGIKIGEDTIPTNGNGAVGMSYRMFKSDDEEIDDGSDPIKMIDTSTFEVIYGVENASLNLSELPALPVSEGIINYNGGYDEAVSGVEFHYMATATSDNNKGSEGTISKIKGEKGEPGVDGKSVTIKGSFSNEDEIRADYDLYNNNSASETKFVYPLTLGDGYLVNGSLYVFTSATTDFDSAGTNVGNIKGEKGESMYLYIGYRDSMDDETVKVGEGVVGKYIGVVVSDVAIIGDALLDPNTYKSGNKWTGEDGGGWEQVFIATDVYEAPYINSNDAGKSESDLIDLGGSDRPISVNNTNNKYVGYLFRKSNESGKGEIEQDEKIYAALYDRGAEDGKDANLEDFSGFNLVPNSDSYVYTYQGDETVMYGRIYLPIEVNAGETYAFKCELAENLLDNDITTFSVGLAGVASGITTMITESSVTCNFGTNISGILTVKEGISNVKADLFFYKGGQMLSNARFTNFSLVKGTTPLSVWENYKEDLDNLALIKQSHKFTSGSYTDVPLKANLKKGEFYTIHGGTFSDPGLMHDFYITDGNDTYLTQSISAIHENSWETFTISEDCNNAHLVLYAQADDTITDVSIVRGVRPMMYWKTGIETDLEYLSRVFDGNVSDNEGAVLSEYVGVKDTNGIVIGALNGSDLGKNEDNKLILAAGFNGIENMGSANARIYADGTSIFGGGQHIFNPDGSGSLSNNAISGDRDGIMIVGKTNIIDGSGDIYNNFAEQTDDNGEAVYYIQVDDITDFVFLSRYCKGPNNLNSIPNVTIYLEEIGNFTPGRTINFSFIGLDMPAKVRLAHNNRMFYDNSVGIVTGDSAILTSFMNNTNGVSIPNNIKLIISEDGQFIPIYNA